MTEKHIFIQDPYFEDERCWSCPNADQLLHYFMPHHGVRFELFPFTQTEQAITKIGVPLPGFYVGMISYEECQEQNTSNQNQTNGTR